MTTGAHRHANQTVAGIGAVALTPSNTTVIPITRAVWVGTAGDLAVTMANGTTATFVNVANGTLLPLQIQLFLTSSTASNVVAIY